MDLRNLLLIEFEELVMPSGAFIAAPSKKYNACWLRDQLYCAISYYYLRNYPKLIRSFQVVFDILDKYYLEIKRGKIIHAKYDAITFEQITKDWGHHQLDAIGLLLYFSAFFESLGIRILRKKDREIIKTLISYLNLHEYWEKPDNGIWEDKLNLHASSIGATLIGLIYTTKKDIESVPRHMIEKGWRSLEKILPNESPDQEVNMSQLSLIWPYNIVSKKIANIILERIKEKLVQKHGLNRYLGDDYYRSDDGISAEWSLGFFWLAIAEFQRRHIKEAEYWLIRGLDQMTDNNHIPELYQNGKPNENTPLGWAMSFALIALTLIKSKS
ncbi:glycoside hydrolase family 15 protein [Patescibacteria group bacterium]|nr:glycoside hydrolase family 15 protein [Patescibacteria group bacterium]